MPDVHRHFLGQRQGEEFGGGALLEFGADGLI
jgi:hypothetical protein